MIQFEECQKEGYPARTIENIKRADLTLAFATNFLTRGEKFTKTTCMALDKPWGGIDFSNPEITCPRIDRLVKRINGLKKYPIIINIAGNGIYSLHETQDFINGFMINFLSMIINHKDAPYISLIRSGGQTGFDEAGIFAADFLGIKAECLAPKGWMFRNIKGEDIKSELLFKARFK